MKLPECAAARYRYRHAQYSCAAYYHQAFIILSMIRGQKCLIFILCITLLAFAVKFYAEYLKNNEWCSATKWSWPLRRDWLIWYWILLIYHYFHYRLWAFRERWYSDIIAAHMLTYFVGDISVNIGRRLHLTLLASLIIELTPRK